MANISVNSQQMQQTAQSTQALTETMRQLAEQISACQKNLLWSDSVSDRCRAHLAQLHQQVLSQAAHMDTLHQALNQIIQLYQTCEQSLSGTLADTASSSQSGTDKRNWWQKLLDSIFGKSKNNYTATTSEQEKAVDLQMQRQIAALMDNDRYSEATWDNASLDERKDILNDFLTDATAVMGVSIRPNINFTYSEPETSIDSATGTTNTTLTWGFYRDFTKTVSINTYVVDPSRSNSYDIFNTIVHELRHAYQHAAIANPTRYQVSQETIDTWKHSFAIYAEESAKGFDAYYALDVEQDARNFSGSD